MRGLGQVGHHVAALDVLPDADYEGVLIAHRRTGAQHIAQGHVLAVGVRDLDADRRFPGDRGEDAHIRRGHRIGDVLRQVRQLVDLHARAENHLVAGDRRPAREARDARIDLEVREDLAEGAHDLVVHRRTRLVRRPRDEQRVLGQRVGDRLGELGLEALADGRLTDLGHLLLLGRRFGLRMGILERGLRGHGQRLSRGIGGFGAREGVGAGVERMRLGERIVVRRRRQNGRRPFGDVGRAEGLVPVVLIEEGVVAGGQAFPQAPSGITGLISAFVLAARIGAAGSARQARRKGAQATGDFDDPRARAQQERVDAQEHEDRPSAPAGQEEREGAGDEPSREPPGGLDRREVIQGGVPRGDVHETAYRSDEAQPAGHVVGQRVLIRVRAEELDRECDEGDRHHDCEHADRSGGRMMDEIARLSGDPEPLAQGDEDGRPQADEGQGIPFDPRIGLTPRLPGRSETDTDRGEDPREQPGSFGLGGGRSSVRRT